MLSELSLAYWKQHATFGLNCFQEVCSVSRGTKGTIFACNV